jgi:hypothetical protein
VIAPLRPPIDEASGCIMPATARVNNALADLVTTA